MEFRGLLEANLILLMSILKRHHPLQSCQLENHATNFMFNQKIFSPLPKFEQINRMRFGRFVSFPPQPL